MRCFVALDLPEELKPRIIGIQKQINSVADVKLVEPENLHFTLKFLGEINEEQAEKAKDILKDIASLFPQFQIMVKNLGAFPSPNYMRVVWIGAPELYNLQKTMDDSFYPEYPKERVVTPHLTLARVRSVRGKEQLKEFITKNKDVEIGSMVVDKIKLKKSVLTKNGPIYEDIAVLELGK